MSLLVRLNSITPVDIFEKSHYLKLFILKKYLFLCSAAMSFGVWNHTVQAQISQGGFPLSMQQDLQMGNTSVHNFANPDWRAFLETRKALTETQQFASPLPVGLHVATDLSFPGSGQLITRPDGSSIWRTTIVVEGAPAIGFLFDRFQLPKGVKLFLTNANKRQVSGAFDASNNPESGRFAIDAVQGEKVFVEMNIDPAVDLNKIELHIDHLLVFQRAIEHLNQFIIPIDGIDDQLNGSSSVCSINAICPQGANYANSRKATVQTIDMSPGGGACSGTLINNTGNTTTNCTPYIITATHCQGTGSLSNASFDQMMVRFNFERPDCAGLMATNGVSMTGVNVLSRSDYHDSMDVDQINGDFMVYGLRQAIPASYGVILAGWDRNNVITTSVTAPRKFIGFHHPFGDNKKLTASQSVESQIWPSGAPDPSGTRWFQPISEGYLGPGSSGSGLFDGEGRLIGIASVASITNNVPDSCFFNVDGDEVYAMDEVWYDKLSHGWEYSVNGTADNRRVKPWLDPANTGVLTLDPVTSACAPIQSTSINKVSSELEANIAVFPNPSFGGKVSLQYNFQYATDLHIAVLDVTGRTVYSGNINRAEKGVKELNLAHVAGGMYIIKVSSDMGYASKKIMINN